MKTKQEVWNIVWQVIKFILTLGLSHIKKREEKQKDENNQNNTNNQNQN